MAVSTVSLCCLFLLGALCLTNASLYGPAEQDGDTLDTALVTNMDEPEILCINCNRCSRDAPDLGNMLPFWCIPCPPCNQDEEEAEAIDQSLCGNCPPYCPSGEGIGQCSACPKCFIPYNTVSVQQEEAAVQTYCNNSPPCLGKDRTGPGMKCIYCHECRF